MPNTSAIHVASECHSPHLRLVIDATVEGGALLSEVLRAKDVKGHTPLAVCIAEGLPALAQPRLQGGRLGPAAQRVLDAATTLIAAGASVMAVARPDRKRALVLTSRGTPIERSILEVLVEVREAESARASQGSPRVCICPLCFQCFVGCLLDPFRLTLPCLCVLQALPSSKPVLDVVLKHLTQEDTELLLGLSYSYHPAVRTWLMVRRGGAALSSARPSCCCCCRSFVRSSCCMF